MSPLQLFRILWARRIVLIIAILSCVVAAFLVGSVLPARYKANSRVMLDVVKPDPVTGEVISSTFARAYVGTQVELIKDYRIAGRVADTLGWTSSPQLAAQYASRSSDDTRDFRRWAAQRIIDNTDARLIEGSNILEISYVGPTPDEAAKVADALRRAYVDQAVAFKREDAVTNADFFRNQTEQIRQQLREAEKRKSDFERANGVVLDSSNNDQESLRLAALAGSAPAAAAPAVPQVNPVAAQLAQADAAIASAEKVLGPNNPELLNMRRQRAAIQQSSRASSVSSGPTGPSIAALYGAQQAKVLAQRGKVDEARQLATDVTVLREQYQKAAVRLAELRQQSETGANSGFTLLGNAVAPQSPDFPKWPLLIFGSLGLGLGLGMLVALLAELIRRRVRGIEDLRYGAVPVLGMMTNMEAGKERQSLLSRLRPTAGAAEPEHA